MRGASKCLGVRFLRIWDKFYYWQGSELQPQLENSAYFTVFEQICGKFLPNFRKLLKFSKLSFFDKIIENFIASWARPRTFPIIAHVDNNSYFSHSSGTKRKFRENLHFSEIFSIIFHIFNNSRANF